MTLDSALLIDLRSTVTMTTAQRHPISGTAAALGQRSAHDPTWGRY
ncbi:MAG TPA: hypothetical protein VJ625_12640 [Propionibacteriaceae bacterium]|nr:hypothetical protein [Propionibacteriaceae bacterium]